MRRRLLSLSVATIALVRVAGAQEPVADLPVPLVPADASEREHVAPAPPSSAPTASSHRAMTDTMGMDDTARYGLLRFDRAEYRDGNALAWNADGWYGGDYNRLWLKTEGGRERGTWDGRIEALWSRVVSRWWSSQLGVRRDFDEGASRTWLAAGVEGRAPLFLDVEATAYVSDQGHLAARLAVSYDLRFTQRLVLRPDLEVTAFNKAEPDLHRGSGVSTAEIGLRLRYELRRELATYAGVDWTRSLGESANELRWVAGVRFWF